MGPAPEAQAWLGTRWEGTEQEKEEIRRHFAVVAAWSRQHNVPVYLGEFGAYSKADMDHASAGRNSSANRRKHTPLPGLTGSLALAFGAY